MSRSRWIAPALWGGLIEVLTSWPRVPDFGTPAGADKVSHFLLYGIFAYLVIRAVQSGGQSRLTMRSMLLTLFVIAAWGALDEWHQTFIDGRSADVADWLADTAGVGVALIVAGAKARSLSSRTV